MAIKNSKKSNIEKKTSVEKKTSTDTDTDTNTNVDTNTNSNPNPNPNTNVNTDNEKNNFNNTDKNFTNNINLYDNKIKKTNNKIGNEQDNLHIPYQITTLTGPIMLTPDQMDNKIYIHTKYNLKNKLEHKCYENYGYIDKIYKLDEISDGIIEPEDPTCSAKINVKFVCKLYIPIVGKDIICKIDRMNKALIMGINGPIKVIITVDKINKEKFFSDVNRNIRIKNTSEILITGMYLKVSVLSRSFGNYDDCILVIGFLQDIAQQIDIDKYMGKNDLIDNVDDFNDIGDINGIDTNNFD